MRARGLKPPGYDRSAIAITIIFVLPIAFPGCASGEQRLANKGSSYIEDGRLTDAERVLTKAVQKNPALPYAVPNLGTVYQRGASSRRGRCS